jgi:hypothetical protein
MLQHAQTALQQLFLGWKKSKERSAHLPRAKLLVSPDADDDHVTRLGVSIRRQSHLLLQAWPTGRHLQQQPVYCERLSCFGRETRRESFTVVEMGGFGYCKSARLSRTAASFTSHLI